MKYVVFESSKCLYPVIIPEAGIHCHVQTKCPVTEEHMRAVSAGSFTIEGGTIKAFGESVSLKLKSDPERDSRLLLHLFADIGIMTGYMKDYMNL